MIKAFKTYDLVIQKKTKSSVLVLAEAAVAQHIGRVGKYFLSDALLVKKLKCVVGKFSEFLTDKHPVTLENND